MKKYETTGGCSPSVTPATTKRKYKGLSASIHAHSVR
jgi:hypothetical protein